jgi:hypothetical protein
MGYHTNFEGFFVFDKPLKEEHSAYLTRFADTRRMMRNVSKLPADPLRERVGLPPGIDGSYFVGGAVEDVDFSDHHPSVADGNCPPADQPSLWCGWAPARVGHQKRDALMWDGSEKFYYYVEWLEYLIKHFIGPWGYRLSGTVCWYGAELDDLGRIRVSGNKVVVERGRIAYGAAS